MAGGATTRTAPWDEQKPYLTAGFEEAGRLYGQGVPDYYPGPTLAGFDPSQTAAQQATLGYAMGPRVGALQDAAQQVTLGQMQGATPFTGGQMSDLLAGRVDTGANTPYADLMGKFGTETMNQLTGTVLPGIRQSLVEYQPGGSSIGNNIQAKAIAAANQQLINKASEMYGSAYDTAQGQRFPAAQMRLGQQQAGQAAYPSIMGAPLEMYGAVGDVGAQRRAMTQEAINQAQQKYGYDVGKDQTALSQYMANISGDYGGTSTATPSGLSQLGQIIGIMGGLK
tara:strand:- start:495 stop:1340 length:846 start_codon:yes stop_codon:yes gene_type:complete